MRQSFIQRQAIAVFLSAPGLSVAGENLVTNGDFELGPAPVPCCIGIDPGSDLIPGWEVFQDQIHYTFGTTWAASSGFVSIDLDGQTFAAGGLRQTVPVVPGRRYALVFDFAGNPGAPPVVKPMELQVESGGLQVDREMAFDTTGRTPEDVGWREERVFFIANGTEAALSFRSLIPSSEAGWGAAIDNVRLIDSVQLGCPADLAFPFGVLDLADIGAFTSGFLSSSPIADLDADGIYDLGDISVFVDSFLAGCP